eukprot:TRINITY_DN21518_c0_g1_i1.p1 TRINITY_DN21518_c0_g1~~TRINITY_DN21518_c0_g1_i1.p1  ORF type:complete len:417 (-),score=42.35 TRINITY_DN21518_c0_g1_i1:55-1305(-)
MISLLSFVCLIGSALASFHDIDYEIYDSEVQYDIRLVGDPKLLISKNVSLVTELENMESNNNIAAFSYQDRLYAAWRTAPVHFAGPDTKLHIASKGDGDWETEISLFLGSDMREPMFYAAEGNLYFTFFQAGTNPIDFEPKGLFRMLRIEQGYWTEPEEIGHLGEVIWDIVEENGTLYSVSYSGDYSTPGDPEDLGKLDLFFNRSTNGLDWEPWGQSVVYHGGLTEVGFGFDLSGNLWGVGRNEDGDDSGWGSRIFSAPASNLDQWTFSEEESNPDIYESPRMFRHGNDLYLVARTDPNGRFWSKDNIILNALPKWEHHLYDLVSFSFRQHGTAIWRLNTETKFLEQVVTLSGCGDTAFPSIVRTGNHTYTIFNYSSSLEEATCPPNWISGQVSPAGSLIYSQDIEFVPQTKKNQH